MSKQQPSRKSGQNLIFPSEISESVGVDDFLTRATMIVPNQQLGRIIFALDATASRQAGWDTACQLQGEMFSCANAYGALEIQLLFYRGFGECRAGNWTCDTEILKQQMNRVTCQGGTTQIERVLHHASQETARRPVNALIFIGDCLEEETDQVCAAAGKLGLSGLPVFLFQEGNEPKAAACFQQIAKLTGGAYLPFDRSSPQKLRDLLAAIAIFATGGLKALNEYAPNRPTLQDLTGQLKR